MTKEYSNEKGQITFGELLDCWVEEILKPGAYSNGTVMSYIGVINRIKTSDIAVMNLKDVTSECLQKYFDLLSMNGLKTLSKGYLRQFSAVMRNSFRFAVFPKKYIENDPMQYVTVHTKKESVDIFETVYQYEKSISVISHKQYLMITEYLDRKNNPARLPFQIAYYTGMRLGEVCGLLWQDINLSEQYITVRRSMRYNCTRHRTELDTTKRNKVRIVEFCDTLADILKKEKINQDKLHKRKLRYRNYYRKVYDKNREHYEVYSFADGTELPDDYNEIELVCVRNDGKYESPDTVSIMCRSVRKLDDGLRDFHFHTLRHTYTCNLLSAGAPPKDVQELLGHSDISTTMNIYAHSSRTKKQSSARLLDKISI